MEEKGGGGCSALNLLLGQDVDGVQDGDAGGGQVVLQDFRVLIVAARGQGRGQR